MTLMTKIAVAGQIEIAGNYHAMLWDDGNIVNLAKLLNLNGELNWKIF